MARDAAGGDAAQKASVKKAKAEPEAGENVMAEPVAKTGTDDAAGSDAALKAGGKKAEPAAH